MLWSVIAFMLGVLFGMFAMAMMAVSDDGEAVMIEKAYEEGYMDGLKAQKED